MQTDDMIMSAIEKCPVEEIRENCEITVETERDHLQAKLENALCSTPINEIIIDVEQIFRDVTEDDFIKTSKDIEPQERV